MLFYCAKFLMLNIRKISEKNKEQLRFVNKQPILKLSPSCLTINWPNEWLKKLIRMKALKSKLIKWNKKIKSIN